MVMMADNPDAAENRCARCPNRLSCRVAALAASFRNEAAPAPLQRRFSALSAGRNTVKQPEQRQERADVVDEVDARGVGEIAEDRRADPGHAEGEAEEEPGDQRRRGPAPAPGRRRGSPRRPRRSPRR